MRGLTTLILLLPACGLAARLQNIATLPTGTTVTALKLDTAGNIYVGGYTKPAAPKSSSDIYDAFLAKLSPDASQTLFRTVLAGNSSDQIRDIALAPDGSILAAGTTGSSDFPATGSTGVSSKGFYARFDPKGTLVTATLLGGTSDTSGEAIAVDAVGAAYITGRMGLPANSAYVAKLDTTGAVVFTSPLIGGNHIALDPQGNIYVSGTLLPPSAVTTTAGSFQPNAPAPNCSNAGKIIPCYHQYVAKLDPTAHQLLYSTFVAGTREESTTALAVDAQGNAYLAGTTTAPDYPVTPGAYQPFSLAGPVPKPVVGVFQSIPDPATGFVSELNPSGTALVFSTYLGGSSMDSVTGLALDSSGNMYVAGIARSEDFPGLSGVPDRCSSGAFVTRLTAGGASLSSTQLLYGTPTLGNTVVALNPSNKPWIAQSATLAHVDLFAAPQRFACATDAADFAVLNQLAPGQLISLFGDNLGLGAPVAATVAFGGNFPTSLAGLSVTVNGTPAPLLYVSPSQVNMQVPFEIAGATTAHIEITPPAAASFPPVTVESRDFAVVDRNPSVFILESGLIRCGTQSMAGWRPAALNPDGTGNSCDNPAPRGSTVTVFLQGVGVTSPTQPTGAIITQPQSLNLALANTDVSTRLISATSIPGVISGIWAVQLQTNAPAATFTVAGIPLRETGLVIWMK